VTCSCGEPSHHIETLMCIFYKEVYEWEWYHEGLLIMLEEFRDKYLQVSHQGFSTLTWRHEHDPQEPWRSRWLQERNAKQSVPNHVHHTHCASRQLGTTADQRYDVPRYWLWDACQLAKVCWGTRCEWFRRGEGPYYRIEQSARNPLEHNQVQRALGKLSKCCHQTSNNQPWFMRLDISWGFLAQAVLRWLSGGLCHARKCQFEDIMWGKKVWFAIAQWTFAWETFGERENGTRKPVLILEPGSREHLTLRKCVMCSRNMGAHIQHSTAESQRYEKMGRETGFPCSWERREETSK
jgi:hypothetical protein